MKTKSLNDFPKSDLKPLKGVRLGRHDAFIKTMSFLAADC